MRITKLCLKNYRNYTNLKIDFNKQKTLIVGKNAQGKTNILESIYMLSCLKSPRTSVFTDLIKFDTDKFSACAELVKNDTDIVLDIDYTSDKKRSLKVNKVKCTPKDFKSVLKVVLFSTKDLLLLRGTPQDRRDWLDTAIFQVYPAYDERLQKYEKLRIQKNNLLKSDKIDTTLLDIFDEQLSICGANIIFLRKKYLKEIEVIASKKHNEISNSETFSINYSASGENVEEICEYLRNEYKTRRQEEIARHQACVGPHRDDIEFKINGLNAVKYASQGQQRTVVLALKLGELDIIKSKTDISPILLLDDVMAELDDNRQLYLLKSIQNNVQTIITSVDTILFDEEFLKDVKIFVVENGQLQGK